MHPLFRKSAGVVAVAAVLALAANGVSYAATGHTLVLGHWNKADSTTTIRDTSAGPALRLLSQGSGEPSLTVSSTARVPHLNASMLQGRYASDLASHSTVFTAGGGNQSQWAGDVAFFLDVAPGVYDVSFDTVIGPSEGSPSDPTALQCGVFSANGFYPYAFASGLYVGSIPPQISADNVVRVRPGGAVLECSSQSSNAQFLFPVRASFVKMNTMTRVHAATPPKSSHRGFTR
jgi:hypothetical protein